jgi:hypothetical protein
VHALESLLVEFNLRTRAQQWLRTHLNLESLWLKIRNHDPSWLQDFLPLPGLMRETLNELRQLNQSLRAQQLEFDLYRKQAQRQRVYDLTLLTLAFLAIFTGLSGNLLPKNLGDLEASQLVMLLVGLMLLFSRLRA